MTRPRPGRALLAGATMTCLLTTACAAAPHAAPHAAPAGPAPAATTAPPAEPPTILLRQHLPDIPGKTFTATLVSIPPGGRAGPPQPADSFIYAYVLHGSVRSRLPGQATRTYRRGENWSEPPGAHRVLTENASRTQPARLLLVFITDTGADLTIADPPG